MRENTAWTAACKWKDTEKGPLTRGGRIDIDQLTPEQDGFKWKLHIDQQVSK